jgi:hypothetical protein
LICFPRASFGALAGDIYANMFFAGARSSQQETVQVFLVSKVKSDNQQIFVQQDKTFLRSSQSLTHLVPLHNFAENSIYRVS